MAGTKFRPSVLWAGAIVAFLLFFGKRLFEGPVFRGWKEQGIEEEGGDGPAAGRILSSEVEVQKGPRLGGTVKNDNAAVSGELPFPFKDGRRANAPAGGLAENAQSVFADISAEILARWGSEYLNTKLFSGGMDFSDGGKVVEDKMLRAVVDQGGFVAAFTGYSVTAGHDCLYEQSYPVLLNATMNRLMAATGVRFEAINVAMGNTRPSPYSFCVDAHAGTNADIISWALSMETPASQCGPAAKSVELFIRSATVLPRRPAVLVMDAMPDQDICISRFRNIDQRNHNFVGDCGSDAEKNLMNVYREFGLHQIYPSTLVAKHTCGDDRFARSKLFGAAEKHYPRPMSWHPAPAGHLLVSDILFMHYAKVFLEALAHLESLAPDVTATELREKSVSSTSTLRLSLGLEDAVLVTQRAGDDSGSDGNGNDDVYMGGGRGDILPPPVWCTDWRFCEGAGNYRCANTYFPLAGKEGSRLLNMVSQRTLVLNRKHKNILVKPKKGQWALTLNEIKPAILTYLETKPPSGMHLPIDMKWVLVGNERSGAIEFEFETLGVSPDKVAAADNADVGTDNNNPATTPANIKLDDSRVVICKPDFIDRVAFHDRTGVKLSIDGVETFAVQLSQAGLTGGSCAVIDAEIGVGRHTLTVEPLKNHGPLCAISHLMYPA